MFYAKDLVNQWALRIKGIMIEGVLPSEKYTDEPVYIIKVTDHHIYVARDKEIEILNFNYLDNNWVAVDPVYFGKPDVAPDKVPVAVRNGMKGYAKN
jgi:hypothetical protein